MANPFKEADKAKKVAPGGNKPHDAEKTEEAVKKIVETAPPVVNEVTEAPVAPVAQETAVEKPKAEKKSPKAANKIEALLGPAEKPKKQERSTMAVYLSKENQAWLKDLAAHRGKSVSELLDQILNELRG
jgi:hypothetical protein